MTETLQHKKFHYFILFLFCIPLFFINIQNTHTYGDDWAQYVKEAWNISQGKAYYLSTYVFNPLNTAYAPPHYPPGYPLLMAPVVAFSGLAISPLLYQNTVFLCLILFLAYTYFCRFTTGLTAMCLAVILGYTTVMTELKGLILSDLPCTLFTLLYLAIRENKRPWSYKKVILLCFIGAFTMLIRPQSIILVFAELALAVWYFIGRKKNRNGTMPLYYPLLLAGGTMLLFFVFSTVIFPAPGNTVSFYLGLYKNIVDEGKVWISFGSNTQYTVDLLLEVFFYHANDALLQTFINVISYSSLPLAIIGLVRMIRKELSFSVVFFLLMCLFMMLTPARQGLRYLLPAVPLFLLLVSEGARAVVPLVTTIKPRIIALSATVVFLLLGYDNYERQLDIKDDWMLKSKDTAAFGYIRNHIADKDIVLFTKPRLLALYSGKRAMNLSWDQSPAASYAQFDALGIKYLLYCRYLTEPAMDDYLKQEPKPYTDSVVINNDYTLYLLRPKP